MDNQDFSDLSVADLKQLVVQIGEELRERNKGQDLIDSARSIITKAHARGFTKAQVAAALTDVVNEIY